MVPLCLPDGWSPVFQSVCKASEFATLADCGPSAYIEFHALDSVSMIRLGLGFSLFFAAAVAVAAWYCVPRGHEAAQLLAAQGDPARLTDLALKSFDTTAANREIETALVGGDADLARSFVELAADRGIRL